jgi:glycosyltransferase involved in cell wall biosynthesis
VIQKALRSPRKKHVVLESGKVIVLSLPGVEFIGEINEQAKSQFLGNALALLFPIDWPEPFGLVMIEAMACGTPVLALRNGSVAEVIEDGVTSHIVESVDNAIHKMGSLLGLDRDRIRQQFEVRFASARMAHDYVRVYRTLLRDSIRHRALSGRQTQVPALAG